MRDVHRHNRRQAGAEVTEAMIRAGVKALAEHVPLDIARPLMAEEDIVTAIYRAMRALECDT